MALASTVSLRQKEWPKVFSVSLTPVWVSVAPFLSGRFKPRLASDLIQPLITVSGLTPEPVRFCCSPFSPWPDEESQFPGLGPGLEPMPLQCARCEHSLTTGSLGSPLHVPCKRRVYVLPPSGSSVPTLLMAFKARHPGGFSSKCRVPGLEEPDAGSDSLLKQNICNRDYVPVCGHLPRCGSCLHCVSALAAYLIVFPCAYL